MATPPRTIITVERAGKRVTAPTTTPVGPAATPSTVHKSNGYSQYLRRDMEKTIQHKSSISSKPRATPFKFTSNKSGVIIQEPPINEELEGSRFDHKETRQVSRSSMVLGQTEAIETMSAIHTIAFNKVSPTGTGLTAGTKSDGKSSGKVIINKTGNYHVKLTGWASSKNDIKVVFHYPETTPDLVFLATTDVPSVDGKCLLNGVSTTLSLRKGETVEVRVLADEPVTISKGLRWEINEC